jgi:hypothetical protein
MGKTRLATELAQLSRYSAARSPTRPSETRRRRSSASSRPSSHSSPPRRERGLLLIVEDVHWADAATRELLDHIARRLTNTSSLVLVTYRSDELDRRHPLLPLLQTWRRSRVAEIVNVSPLEQAEIAEMIAAILDHDQIGTEFRDLMHARTEGIPSCSRRCCASRSTAATSTLNGWDQRRVRSPERAAAFREGRQPRLGRSANAGSRL